MRHTLHLAAAAAALMAVPALAQDEPATDQAQAPAGAAVEQPAAEAGSATSTQTVAATTGGDGGAAPAAGTPMQALTLAAERLQEVAQQIQGSGAGAAGTTTDGLGVATPDVAAATADGTAGAATGDGGTVTTIVTTNGGSQDVERQATEALDQFDQAVQGVAGSPEGQPAQQQIALIQQQSQQVRQQLEDDPQAASEGMQQLAQAALQLQTAQIPADARSIIGKQLVSSDGEEAGAVRDVLVTPDGQVNALVMERGGALGLGGQQVAVQWAQVQVQGDQLTVNMTSDQIDQLPEYQTD